MLTTSSVSRNSGAHDNVPIVDSFTLVLKLVLAQSVVSKENLY